MVHYLLVVGTVAHIVLVDMVRLKGMKKSGPSEIPIYENA